MDAAINYIISLWEKLIDSFDNMIVTDDISLLGVIIAVVVIVTTVTLVFGGENGGSD